MLTPHCFTSEAVITISEFPPCSSSGMTDFGDRTPFHTVGPDFYPFCFERFMNPFSD
jgi:hypothetical protein